jgi:hypothetical protein
MGKEERGGLPELDDSDVLVLRRQDGSFVTAFGAREVTTEIIVEAAKEDHARLVQAHASDPSRLREDVSAKGRSARDDAERSSPGEASRAANAGGYREREDRRKAKKALRRRASAARPPHSPAEGGEDEAHGLPTGGRRGSRSPRLPCERGEHVPKRYHGRVRWYNPMLGDFEWREVPQTDEKALEVLDDPPRSTACEAYRQWRELGASIRAALIRAGEAAKAYREREKAGAAEVRRGRA